MHPGQAQDAVGLYSAEVVPETQIEDEDSAGRRSYA